jgi:aminopeptidase-like protein
VVALPDDRPAVVPRRADAVRPKLGHCPVHLYLILTHHTFGTASFLLAGSPVGGYYRAPRQAVGVHVNEAAAECRYEEGLNTVEIPNPTTVLTPDDIGREMYELITELYPLCRSITGDGLRQTLSILKKHIPLDVHEVPTGTQVFDWTVPKEWNIRDAYVKNSQGERIIDYHRSNLHIVSYSPPLRKTVRLEELREHLHTLPDRPDWIPYRTSYYQENWGFCLSYNQFLELLDDEYEVCIDASLENGHLAYGEYYLPGEIPEEVLLSCHVCHPSLCNDNLSGIALVAFLAKYLRSLPRRYSYRFLFIPGTIGSITWLCLNEPQVAQIKHGFVVAGVGDAGNFTYKKSRRGDAEIDMVFGHVLKHSGSAHAIIDFFPYGYDERQFCSPAFNLPVGCLMRTPYGQYPEYHTSADDLQFISTSALTDSFMICLSAVNILEHNKTYVNQNPKCEPRLGKRGLYRTLGGRDEDLRDELALLWVLNLSDGTKNLLEIADRSGYRFEAIKKAADALFDHNLLGESRID